MTAPSARFRGGGPGTDVVGPAPADAPTDGAPTGADLPPPMSAAELLDRPRQFARAVVRRVHDPIVAHPHASLGVAGFVTAWVAVVAGGRIGPVHTTIPLTSWLGLLSRNGQRTGTYWASGVMVVALTVLVGLWLVAVRINRPTRCTERTVWWLTAAWATPFVIGPPLLSGDVWSYAAQGLMQRLGIDVYQHGPAVMGSVKAVAAVDPNWRSVTSPYGPLSTMLEHLTIAISGGSALGAVILFRAIAVLATILVGLLAAELAGPRRVQALTMTALNPLMLVHVVSGAHLDGVMCALLLATLVAANQRHWALAVVLGVAAGDVKAPGYLAAAGVIIVHALDRPGHISLRFLARDSALAIAVFGATTMLVPDGLGWIKGLNTPSLGHTPWAPSNLLAALFTPLVPGASYDDRSAGGRITTLLAAGCVMAFLLVTARRRSLNRTVGYGLLAFALAGPVVYPWYLLWGVLCLAPTARVARLDWLVLISGLFCVIAPPGFSSGTTIILATVQITVAAALIAPRVRQRQLAGAQARPAVTAPLSAGRGRSGRRAARGRPRPGWPTRTAR